MLMTFDSIYTTGFRAVLSGGVGSDSRGASVAH